MSRQRTKITFSKNDIEILKCVANIKATQSAIYQKYGDKRDVDTSFLVESETEFSSLAIDRIIRELNIKGVPDKKVLKEFQKLYDESEV